MNLSIKSALATFVIVVISNTSYANLADSSGSNISNWCDKPIDFAVKQGSKQFTKKMVRNLTRAALQIDKTKTSEQASTCIILGLQKRRLPYQF